MTLTIGLVANMYNEANALPGWLETHLSFFDDVRVLHAGPQGEYSNDGTIELLEKWKVPVEFCAIDDGFGAVRTRALRMSKCDYIMLLDADERFYHAHNVLTCDGQPTPQNEVDWILQSYDFRGVNLPNWENIGKLGEKLRVNASEVYDQGADLRLRLGSQSPDVAVTCRRHWHDLAMRRPTQNWYEIPDLQARTVRNDPSIYFDPAVRMHEQLMGGNKVMPCNPHYGPFFDHFHFHFKRMEPKQRGHDIVIYDSIHAGTKPPTQAEFNK